MEENQESALKKTAQDLYNLVDKSNKVSEVTEENGKRINEVRKNLTYLIDIISNLPEFGANISDDKQENPVDLKAAVDQKTAINTLKEKYNENNVKPNTSANAPYSIPGGTQVNYNDIVNEVCKRLPQPASNIPIINFDLSRLIDTIITLSNQMGSLTSEVNYLKTYITNQGSTAIKTEKIQSDNTAVDKIYDFIASLIKENGLKTKLNETNSHEIKPASKTYEPPVINVTDSNTKKELIKKLKLITYVLNEDNKSLETTLNNTKYIADPDTGLIKNAEDKTNELVQYLKKIGKI